jgi:hypothetical protein
LEAQVTTLVAMEASTRTNRTSATDEKARSQRNERNPAIHISMYASQLDAIVHGKGNRTVSTSPWRSWVSAPQLRHFTMCIIPEEECESDDQGALFEHATTLFFACSFSTLFFAFS